MDKAETKIFFANYNNSYNTKCFKGKIDWKSDFFVNHVK